jgi:hypothetical protein
VGGVKDKDLIKLEKQAFAMPKVRPIKAKESSSLTKKKHK